MKLFKTGNLRSPIRQVIVSQDLRFFEFHNTSSGKYVVRVVANVPASVADRVQSIEQRVELVNEPVHLHMQFPQDLGSTSNENAGSASFLTLLIGFVLFVAAINHEEIMTRFEKMKSKPMPTKPSSWVPAKSPNSEGGSRRHGRRGSRKAL